MAKYPPRHRFSQVAQHHDPWNNFQNRRMFEDLGTVTPEMATPGWNHLVIASVGRIMDRYLEPKAFFRMQAAKRGENKLRRVALSSAKILRTGRPPLFIKDWLELGRYTPSKLDLIFGSAFPGRVIPIDQALETLIGANVTADCELRRARIDGVVRVDVFVDVRTMRPYAGPHPMKPELLLPWERRGQQ